MHTHGTAPVIELDRVTVEYPGHGEPVRALHPASLEISHGESVAVVGRSGSGKSSLVSVIGLMRTPTSGTVKVKGETVHASPEAMRRARSATVGMVFQSFHLEPHLTAAENCMLSWYATDGAMSRKDARRRATDLIGIVGLGHLSRRRVSDMSGGERQRVAIARALFSEPPMVVADEPTGNLDEATAEHIGSLLWSLPAQTGAAVVVVTHDAHVASGAGRVLHLAKGVISASEAFSTQAGDAR